VPPQGENDQYGHGCDGEQAFHFHSSAHQLLQAKPPAAKPMPARRFATPSIGGLFWLAGA
jgi:hypothetical protein